MTGLLPEQVMKAPPTVFMSCYISAKLIHAHKLVELRGNWPKIYFTAHWPLVAVLPSEQAKPAKLWQQDNTDDILRAETFLLYADPHDELKGSLFEAGIAWMAGKQIYLAGENKAFGGWSHADRVTHFTTIESALKTISKKLDYQPSHFDKLDARLGTIEANVKKLSIPGAAGFNGGGGAP